MDKQPSEDQKYLSLDMSTYDAVSETKEQERKLRKRKLKKEKKKKLKEVGCGGDSSDDEDNNMMLNDDEIVEFVTPSGDVYELRAFGDASQSKYDVKLHMCNERTFFKYLFASFHLGAMGTFLLTFFTQNDTYKMTLVVTTWLAAFSFIFWGLQSFYHRKTLMEAGRIKSVEDVNPHGPAYVTLIFFMTFLFIIIYAIISHQVPGRRSAMKGVPPPITAFLPSE